MDDEIPFLSGFLNVPTQSGFSLISKKKSLQRYCLLFKASRHGIERLEICESKEDKNPKIITLENCVKITQEPSSLLIHIVKKTGTLTLNALTEEDLKEWVTALQTVAFRDKGGTMGRLSTTIEEDNDLYCSSYGDGLFVVKLIPSATSIKCNFEPKNYMLHLTTTDIQLKSVEDLSCVIAKWPYKFIRKYGYSDGKFTFEAGRKCKTGEGIFTFYHSNSIEVFRCMSSKTKSMKKLLSGDSLNNLDCSDNQLSAALSMGAGSRSPIPPSSNQSTTISSDFDINTSLTRAFLSSNDSLNNVSVSSTTASTSVANSTGPPAIPPPKHIPNKPPRKLLSPIPVISTTTSSSVTISSTSSSTSVSCDKFRKFQNYEPVSITTDSIKTNSSVILKPTSSISILDENSPPDLPVRNLDTSSSLSHHYQKSDRDYESIETITDAWKTLGLGEVKHIEHITTPEDDLIDFVWQRTQSQREKGCVTPLKPQKLNNSNSNSNLIDHLEDSSEENYDRLDFLSPNNKIISSSGYKTIVTVTNPSSSANSNTKKKNSSTAGSSSVNDYELIANPDIQPCRIADDSYLGYGVLRKSSLPGPQVPTNATSSGASVILKNISSGTIITTDDPSLDHRNYNGMNYAIVSKPKRV